MKFRMRKGLLRGSSLHEYGLIAQQERIRCDTLSGSVSGGVSP